MTSVFPGLGPGHQGVELGEVDFKGLQVIPLCSQGQESLGYSLLVLTQALVPLRLAPFDRVENKLRQDKSFASSHVLGKQRSRHTTWAFGYLTQSSFSSPF